MMDSFSEYLSEKHPENSSIDDTKHYQTVIINKIVRMFHSLDFFIDNSQDEVSARCLLRGILDSVTTYCFIYRRTDVNDMLFRHFLFALDGLREYKKSVIPITVEIENKNKVDYACDCVIKQIEEKLRNHPFYVKCNTTAESLIRNANWKYESLQNSRSIKFEAMYAAIGFDVKSIGFYQGFLSQFAHGLCLSNKLAANSEQMKRVLYECIPIADKFTQTITQTFQDKGMMTFFISSDIIQSFLSSKDFDVDNLLDFAKGLIRKDKLILI